MAIDWKAAGEKTPPIKERLLLIISAAGSLPNTQLVGQSEMVVGLWTRSSGFRPLAFDATHSLSFQVSHWATLRDLPPGVVWQPRSEFAGDLRD